MKAEPCEQRDRIEAGVVSASFAFTVREITDAADAQRALQFLVRMRRLIDFGFRFDLRADPRKKQ